MKRLFQSIAILVGAWLLGSFLGVMFDPGHKNLWTQSLMWALLSCVVLAPVFLFISTAETSSSSPTEPKPFEVEESTEVNDANGSEQEAGWPNPSESKQSRSSGGSGTVS